MTDARSCVECGDVLKGRGRRLYCSTECALVDRECGYCGKVERVLRKRRNRPFCSQRCAKAANGLRARVQKVTRECQYCGGTYELYPSKDTPRRKFCSRQCAGLGRPINCKPSKIATEAISLFLDGFDGPAEPEKRMGRWSIDLALPEQRLAIEMDGVYWHSLPAMVEKDERKARAVIAAGWTAVSIPIRSGSTPEQLAHAIGGAVAATQESPCRH